MNRTAAEVTKSLRKKLIRQASEHPELRPKIFPLLRKMGVAVPVTIGAEAVAKQAAAEKVAVKEETEQFISWALSTQTPMSPTEVENFVNRTLGVKTSPPVKRESGPRFKKGDSIEIVAKKHTGKDKATYELYDGKIGVVHSVDGDDVMVAFEGVPAPVRIPDGMKPRGVGIYKYTKPYDVEGSAKIEMIYVADPTADVGSDQKATVEVYLGKARGKEKRSANFYTGHIVFGAVNQQGQFYFRGFPQQRMRVDPKAEGGFQARSFNPSKGSVYYIGLFNQRPSNWKATLEKLQAASEASAVAP